MEECFDYVKEFLDNKEYQFVFLKHKITDEQEIIRTIEKYKLIPREEIVRRMNKIYNGDYMKTVELQYVTRSDNLYKLEKKHNVVIHLINSSSCIVYYNPFEELDKETIRMELDDFNNIKFQAITERNLEELNHIQIKASDYDYDLLLKFLVLDCVACGGTDLHINTRHSKLKTYYTIDYRRDNYMWRNDNFRFNQETIRNFVYKTIERKTEKGVYQDIAATGVSANVPDLLGDGKYELRVTVVSTLRGWKMTARIQRMKTVSLKIQELGFDKPVEDNLKFLATKTDGLTLITGPVRSGKNTTAFAMANNMDLDKLTVMDYSSPVEVFMDFSQVDYGGSEETLKAHIAKAKKLDVDIAFINEIPSKDVAFGIRDLVNSSIGVITTTHLNRVWHIPHKLKEYFGDDYKDMMSQINAVINQKMYVKQCPHCTRTILIDSLDKPIREYLEMYGVVSVTENDGCDKCEQGMLKGGIQPFTEMLIFTEEVKKALRVCDYPYQMEDVIYNLLHQRKESLDYKVTEAIKEGKLHYKAVITLL